MSTTTLTPIRLGEGGRAALAFRHGSDDPSVAQREALKGASRANILRHWLAFPQWLRRDQGFQCLMDNYCPSDAEAYEQQRARRNEMLYDTVKQLFGTGALRSFPQIPTDEEVMGAIKAVGVHRACVDYGVVFGGQTAISTTSTAKTVAGIKPAANQSVRLWGFDIGFDGVTSTSGPGIVEIMQNTWASNSGSSSSATPQLIDFGRPETINSTGLKAFTSEPTVLTTVENFFIPNYMGSGIVFTPLTKPFILTSSKGGSMRITQQSGITGNATGTLKGEE